MGGMLSTRWNRHSRRATVQDGLVLDFKRVAPNRLLSLGIRDGAEVRWPDGQTVMLAVDTLDRDKAFMALRFTITLSDGREHEQTQKIPLVAVPNRFGGYLWFALCPVTNKRCLKLCLPPGGWRFASRKAYGLAYNSQRYKRTDRLLARSETLRNRVLDTDGHKRKGLHWQTWERVMDQADELESFGVAYIMRRLLNA